MATAATFLRTRRSTSATMDADLSVKNRQRGWKGDGALWSEFERVSGPIKSPCHAAWRNAAHRKRIREWLMSGEGLQLTIEVSYQGMYRSAVFWREWRQYPKLGRMMVAVDRVSGDVFGGRPE